MKKTSPFLEKWSVNVLWAIVKNVMLIMLKCTVNGISYDKLSQGAGVKVKCLEVFFFGCSRVVDLHHFSSLSCLRIVNQKISRMIGIGTCSTLQELWICEGNIEVSTLCIIYTASSQYFSVTSSTQIVVLVFSIELIN